MAVVFSEQWFQELSLGRLGCKWAVGTHDPQSRRLTHSHVKALGDVWAGYGQWGGTDGRSHQSLRAAKKCIEQDVAKAIAEDLAHLDEALAGGGKPTVISHLSLNALECGMEDAIVAALTHYGKPVTDGRRLPDGCFIGVDSGKGFMAFNRPSIPSTVMSHLRHFGDYGQRGDGRGISIPALKTRQYSSLAELVEVCENDVIQRLDGLEAPAVSSGG